MVMKVWFSRINLFDNTLIHKKGDKIATLPTIYFLSFILQNVNVLLRVAFVITNPETVHANLDGLEKNVKVSGPVHTYTSGV